MSKTNLIWLLSGLAALTIAGGVWYLSSRMSSLSYSNSSAPAEVLMARNQSYVLANSYQKEGKFDLALQSYQEALLAAEDRVQATQIRLDIAFMTEFLGNYKEAISQLKTIAANSSDSYAIARAYA